MSDPKITLGDDNETECPSCGKLIYLGDFAGDNCLQEGHVDTCEHCGAEFKIISVDYSATVRLQAKE